MKHAFPQNELIALEGFFDPPRYAQLHRPTRAFVEWAAKFLVPHKFSAAFILVFFVWVPKECSLRRF